MQKKKRELKTYSIKIPRNTVKHINGVMYVWVPNPLAKKGGYWRKAR